MKPLNGVVLYPLLKLMRASHSPVFRGGGGGELCAHGSGQRPIQVGWESHGAVASWRSWQLPGLQPPAALLGPERCQRRVSLLAG